MKVVINRCYGGFSLSPAATLWLYDRKCSGLDVTHVDEYWPLNARAAQTHFGYAESLAKWRAWQAGAESSSLFVNVFSPDEQYVLNAREVPRDDPLLIEVVQLMGSAANGACAKLEVIEVPDDAAWEIEEYDGLEHVAEKHRTWS